VKAGTIDPDFPDLPLGGWTGKVRQLRREPGTNVCLVAWDRYTLHNVHPAYRSRCAREGLDLESLWMEEGVLEPDRGEPAAIEQPVLTARPLDPADEGDRVRAALGVADGDEPIPHVELESLRRYYDYLVSHLTFPFPGRLSDPIGPHQDTRSPLRVVRLLDVDDYEPEEMYGLICKAEQNGERIELPLDRIDVTRDDPNHRLVADYSFWMANWG
jgi:hypothetical protein